MNYSLMEILLIALLGCFFIRLLFYFLSERSRKASEKVAEKTIALAKATKEIEMLNIQLEDKSSFKDSSDSNYKKVNSYESMLGNNLPIIEITDLDLSEETTVDINDENSNRPAFVHQLRFYVFNVGKSSLKEVYISIKDIYNDPKDIKKRSRTIGQHDDESIDFKDYGIGTFENFEIGTLNLKSRRLVYASTLPNSFGVAEYSFSVVVEWKGGFYQMDVRIEEFDGKLKYFYQYFDVSENPINFELLESNIKK
ncbi:MAG TPA: hypothetical protein PK218_08870 [Flavobacterium sp.]|jgi:hypothetical protein|uniref:hypothetical protein n=1 Tax=Flavobacterium sp. TaxID=239 RepID=UPI002CB16637|nr:hypothetical protein [Flavobacterium sp.]MCA0349374.1 hypothetical protein [Bacteroidota bacterium]HPW98660.1 hypothetical protein [Flavobacterium sp.]HQA75039.1 hypothetical protein [Flavobacterium sp.]